LWSDAVQRELLGKILIKPKYGRYAMKQAILFECFDKMQFGIYQAIMAKHIFSRVAHSYVTNGGFNSISGGTSISSARDLADAAYDAHIAVTDYTAILERIQRQTAEAQQELDDDRSTKDGQKRRTDVKRLEKAYDDGRLALAESEEKLRGLKKSFDDEMAEKWSAAKRFALAIKEEQLVDEKVDEVIALMESMVETVKQLAAVNAAQRV